MPAIRSVEAFRLTYGRTPTVAEFRATLDAFAPERTRPEPPPRHCGYCYDPECSVCCDEHGNVR